LAETTGVLNTIIKHIELNVSQPNNYEIVHIMQGTNNTIKIIAAIYNGNIPYDIETENIKICMTDGATSNQKPIILPCIICNDKQSVELTIDHTISDYNGDIYLSIAFENDDGDAIYTYPFIIRVTGTPIGDAQKEDISGVISIIERSEDAASKSEEYYSKTKELYDRVSELPDESVSETEPTNQQDGDFWLSEYS
jgi:hypothetical protein